MMFRKYIRYTAALSILAIMGSAGIISAKEDISNTHHKSALKTTAAAGCNPGSIQGIDMDINNIRAHLMTAGDMWWNIGTQVAAYEIPKGSGKSSQFASSCWIGGFDKQGQLKVAAQTYRQDGNDYWPGALDANGTITKNDCSNWDQFWKVNKADINQFIQLKKLGGAPTSNQFPTIFN